MLNQLKIFLFASFGLFCCFYYSCKSQNTSNTNELDDLKKVLFNQSKKNYKMPIYADPPTADYEEFKKDVFSFQIDSATIIKINQYKKELEPFIVPLIDSGFTWVYLAAYLKYESAVPKIKNKLLTCYRFYGWEGPDYSKIESYIVDDIQYCYQMAYIAAIEHIVNKPIDKAITLSNDELNSLQKNAAQCIDPNQEHIEKYCSSLWLLKKLKLQ